MLSAKNVFRIWLPLLLCAIGVVILVVRDFDGFGVSAFAGFVGAGASMWLTSTLWRIGVGGERDRDDEQDARRYLEQHGHWPDDEPGKTP